MRTSNKILIGICLAALIIPAAICATVYIKYKTGHIEPLQRSQVEKPDRHVLPTVKFVKAYGMAQLRVMPADTVSLAVEKYPRDGRFRFYQSGDTLLLRNDSSVALPDPAYQEPDYKSRHNAKTERVVVLYLPSSVPLDASFCDVHLHGATDTANAPSYNIDMVDGYLYFVAGPENPDAPYYWKRLDIRAVESIIAGTKQARINELSIVMKNTLLRDNMMRIGTFSLDTDSTSTLELQGHNLQNLHRPQ